MTASEDDIRRAINTIVDPCSRAAGVPAGLVDMALLRRLEVTSGPDGVVVRAVVGVTEYGCLMGPAFATEIDRRVRELPGVAVVEVELDGAFDWVPEDMTHAYQEALTRRRKAGNAHFLALRHPDASSTSRR